MTEQELWAVATGNALHAPTLPRDYGKPRRTILILRCVIIVLALVVVAVALRVANL